MSEDTSTIQPPAVALPESALLVIDSAIQRYKGDVSILESAIGAYVMAHYTGWGPLSIMHSPATLKRWGAILGIDWELDFPKEGLMAHRSSGYRFASGLKRFVDGVKGNVSVPDRRTLTVRD